MFLLRRLVQFLFTLLLNAHWGFLKTGGIYQGPLKSVCSPGLNCYACPAALTACPIGALQHFMASVRAGISFGQYQFGLYVIGFLGLIGSLVGRLPCGWLCPFGFLQDLLYKIPFLKLPIPRFLHYLKYLILIIMVLVLPLFLLDTFGYGLTWFCKIICPAGTLEGALPMLALNPVLRSQIGTMFYIKLSVLIFFLLWMMVSSRPFCRTTCPLGAIYGLFNRFSLLQMTVNKEKCVKCETCYHDCPMGVRFYQSPNDSDCIRCFVCYRQSCKYGAIGYEWKGFVPQGKTHPVTSPS